MTCAGEACRDDKIWSWLVLSGAWSPRGPGAGLCGGKTSDGALGEEALESLSRLGAGGPSLLDGRKP